MLQKPAKPRIKNRHNLFILDGFGALLSAFLLGIVLVHFQSYFGIPKSSLYILAAIPCVFALYDLCCYLFVKRNINLALKTIAILNILYCIFSVFVAFSHSESILTLGWIYVIIEIAIVVWIARLEWKAVN